MTQPTQGDILLHAVRQNCSGCQAINCREAPNQCMYAMHFRMPEATPENFLRDQMRGVVQ